MSQAERTALFDLAYQQIMAMRGHNVAMWKIINALFPPEDPPPGKGGKLVGLNGGRVS